LEAAGEVFAQKGFRDATIREICARAGANIAAINYHFGGKERLYSEVLRYVDSLKADRHPFNPPETSVTAEARLAWFVKQFLASVFDTDRPAWHQRIMNREMVEPTFALDELVDNNIKKRAIILQGIVREILGPGASEKLVQRGAASVVGQCLFYWHCKPVIGRLMPQLGFSPEGAEQLAAHVTQFSIAGLAGMRREIQGAPNGGVA
jgi:AcrR family transcriptional regulator